jgi:hypothetical protein
VVWMAWHARGQKVDGEVSQRLGGAGREPTAVCRRLGKCDPRRPQVRSWAARCADWPPHPSDRPARYAYSLVVSSEISVRELADAAYSHVI